MSRSTANVSFYCRESKKNRDGLAPDGLAPIELVIILNTRRCFIQLPRKEYPEKFRAQRSGKKRTDLIDYLDGVRARLNQVVACGWPLDGYRKVTEVLIEKFSDACKLLMLNS